MKNVFVLEIWDFEDRMTYRIFKTREAATRAANEEFRHHRHNVWKGDFPKYTAYLEEVEIEA